MTNKDIKARLKSVSDQLVESYNSRGGINLTGAKNLPSQRTIVGIVEELLALIFPGYVGDPISRETDLDGMVDTRLDKIHKDLQDVVERTLAHCAQLDCLCNELWAEAGLPEGTLTREQIKALARRLTLEYLDQLPAIRSLLDADVQAAYEGDPAVGNTEEIILCYPGVRAIAVHRLAHPLFVLGLPLVPRIMSEWAHSQTGVDIHPGARIGSFFFIDHGTGVVIGETAIIGTKVKIYQGVTLGGLSFPKNPDGSLVKGGQRHPTIEDRVTIYANATILGGETVVGERAEIGGGCWVTRSVPAGARIRATKNRSTN